MTLPCLHTAEISPSFEHGWVTIGFDRADLTAVPQHQQEVLSRTLERGELVRRRGRKRGREGRGRLNGAGGGAAINVPISPWLYVCTMLGALFIGFGKRRHELQSLEGAAGQHRANLDDYSLQLLDQIIAIISSAILMAYSLYTFDASNVPDNHAMMLTIPFVLYALFRYLYLIYQKKEGGSPEVLLFTDRPMLFSIVSWGLSSGIILYLTR